MVWGACAADVSPPPPLKGGMSQGSCAMHGDDHGNTGEPEDKVLTEGDIESGGTRVRDRTLLQTLCGVREGQHEARFSAMSASQIGNLCLLQIRMHSPDS